MVRRSAFAVVVVLLVSLSFYARAQDKPKDVAAARPAKGSDPAAASPELQDLSKRIAVAQRDLNALEAQYEHLQLQIDQINQSASKKQTDLNDLVAQAQKLCGDPKEHAFDPQELTCSKSPDGTKETKK